MGFPIRNLNDLLRVEQRSTSMWPYPIKAFFIYTNKNKQFSSFIRDKFLWLDRVSGSVIFYLINTPPKEWLEVAQERTYWNHFIQMSGGNIRYDDRNVHEVADYFGVNRSSIPCVILFRSLQESEYIALSGFGSLGLEELRLVFEKIFKITEEFLRYPDRQNQDYVRLLTARLRPFKINTNFIHREDTNTTATH
ncbi:MAG: hypothetical protein FJ110_17400 [Deltaproteobacteria bacterium]|nr:hypothetical protein [Deltaproteobacteria bacterium]MBM4341309.1 hypothetical protein [Deltaproteobacteria bacterium]